MGKIHAVIYTEKTALILRGTPPLEKKGATTNTPNILTKMRRNIWKLLTKNSISSPIEPCQE
jgi:hypothetical protein